MLSKLYLYTDNFSFSDYFSSNCIACESFMANKKGSRTISRNTQFFLFITHKKIDTNSRLAGIADHVTSWPVILEFDFTQIQIEKAPVIFIEGAVEEYTLTKGDLMEYDPSKHLGCYVFSELPFSAVSRILFENKDQLSDSDKSTFPDFLWRSDIVNILCKDEFTEHLEFSVPDDELLQIFRTDQKANEAVSNANKYKSAILQLINGTKQWQVGKYRTSFDSVVLDFFSISEDIVKEILTKKGMPTPDEVFRKSSETLDLIPIPFQVQGKSTFDQLLYNTIAQAFLSNREKCSPEIIHSLLGKIKEEFAKPDEQLSKIVDEMEKCFSNAIRYTVDKVVNDISSVYSGDSVLKALLFVVKNPAEYDKFVRSLSLYKTDVITARRAMVLWGFLNGTRGIPARCCGRDNVMLWSSIEWKYAQVSAEALWKYKQPVTNPELPCGIEITSEEVITFEEIHEYFITQREKESTRQFLKDIYTIAKNTDRKLSKTDPYCRYVINDETFYSKLYHLKEESKPLSKAELDAFEKAFTKKYKEILTALKKNAELDFEGIYRDWIVNQTNFRKIWDLMEDKIKAFYVGQRGKHE